MPDLPGHAPDVARILHYFGYADLSPKLQAVAAPCSILAHEMARTLPDGDDLTTGLELLLGAQKAFVRAAVA